MNKNNQFPRLFPLLISILVVVLVGLAGCAEAPSAPEDNQTQNQTPPDNGMNGVPGEEPNQELIAREFLMRTDTYQFDGSQLLLTNTRIGETSDETLFTYTFQSRYSGYGDRDPDRVVIMNQDHTAKITVMGEEVTSAVIDDYWNALTGEELNTAYISMRYRPAQCVDTPWELWFETDGQDEFSGIPPDSIVIQSFYDGFPGVDIKNVQKIPYEEVTCQACEICKRSYYYTLQSAEGFSTEQLTEDDWEFTLPLTDAEAKIIAREWIEQAPTYGFDGENLTYVIHQTNNAIPQTYTLTYEFTSRNGGYGNRSEAMSIDAEADYHSIQVEIKSGIVSRAIIDGVWDEIAQERLT